MGGTKTHLGVASRIDQHVLRLEITVEDAPVVQVLESEREARLMRLRVKVAVRARVGNRVGVGVGVRVRVRVRAWDGHHSEQELA